MLLEVSIVVPTYNERSNLKTLVGRVHQCLSNYDYELIIVDDNSPDATGKLAVKLAQTYPIRVLQRESKMGLASAIADGFKLAGGNVIGVMDADLQHPPEKLPELLNKIHEGADIAIGSRYIRGGCIKGWSFKRKVVSKVATFLAEILFSEVRGITDPVSGFFFLRREVLKDINISPVGYKILLEILVKGTYKGIVEVPYTFEGRVSDESKMNFHEYINYLRHLHMLRSRRKN
jgi:dolichol-phosphate mannosyltransferase